MVEPWNKQVQLSPEQRHFDATEKSFVAPQNGEIFNNCAGSGSQNIATCFVKEHPVVAKGEQTCIRQIRKREEAAVKHKDVKGSHKIKEGPDAGSYEEVKIELTNGKSEDFTIMKDITKVQAKICRTDVNTKGISEPIVLICQIPADFNGSVSSESDADSLSTGSSSPIFSHDQDLSLWSTLWDPPLASEPLKQLTVDPESLHQMSNETANCQSNLINRLETWSTGVKKKFRSQFHQLTQRAKPKIRSPEQIKVEEDDGLLEEHKLEDGFSDIPLV